MSDSALTFPATPLAILRRLASTPGFVSGESLAAELGLSRAAVSKAVARLREDGYEVESSPRVGHRLVSRPDRLIAPEVLDGLETTHLGRYVAHFDRTRSTQPIARDLADAGAPHGTLVVAEEQDLGRGRLNRPYASPRGGIWATVVLRGPLPASRAPLVSLAAGVAAARAIAEVTGLEPVLKWPNDVLVNGKKVAGILTELVAEEQAVHYLLVGTGINANFPGTALPADIRGSATTLLDEAGAPIARLRLLQRYLGELERLFEQLRESPADVVAAWRSLPNTIGRRVRADLWEGSLHGTAVALLDDGALLIRTTAGEEVRITAGDVLHAPTTEENPA